MPGENYKFTITNNALEIQGVTQAMPKSGNRCKGLGLEYL